MSPDHPRLRGDRTPDGFTADGGLGSSPPARGPRFPVSRNIRWHTSLESLSAYLRRPCTSRLPTHGDGARRASRPAAEHEPEATRWAWRGHDVHIARARSAEAPVRVLVIHGAGGHSGALWPLAALLAERGLDIAAVDLPLYGRTAVPDPGEPATTTGGAFSSIWSRPSTTRGRLATTMIPMRCATGTRRPN